MVGKCLIRLLSHAGKCQWPKLVYATEWLSCSYSLSATQVPGAVDHNINLAGSFMGSSISSRASLISRQAV